MTTKERAIMQLLFNAARNASAYFNMKAQAQLLGLNKPDDDIRQALCTATSAASGILEEEPVLYCGNLSRTGEIKDALRFIQTLDA